MTAMSDYLENKVLDHVLGTTSFTMPTNTYMGLYTSTPTDAFTGATTTGVPTTGGYARQNVDFATAASGTTSNTAVIIFTATGASWGSVTHWRLFDALTVGNLLIWGAFTVARTIG